MHGRILLVDDNVSGSTARKTVLEELGHKIHVASSGADALEQFSQHKFDLVVTDYKMPRMDGLELIVRLRKQSPDILIVMVSGFVDTLGLNESGTGADAVIQKSANEVTHLVRAVNRLMRRKKPARGTGGLKAKRQAG
jgi:CheY-like chemotaxis protein